MHVYIYGKGIYGVYVIYDNYSEILNLSEPGAPNTTGSWPWEE